ncbi:uncharacterized protein KD926_002626 [Aspergillus affinis]|uniref:uncharacterized protein n=1 Tax=Aspergillus affinis TaxID=1070780 RepID=UPI0022FDE9C0|nr:uncharacterized protein KD926_002626 [Aspergillus affinis]KAI9035910.1 hypothetical protein KD926_002626 [Aspergillus affinis]
MSDSQITWSTDGAAHVSWNPAGLPDPESLDFRDCNPIGFATNSAFHYLPLDLNARAAASNPSHMASSYTHEAKTNPDHWYSSDLMHAAVQPAVQQSLDPASHLPTQTINGNSTGVSGILDQEHKLEPYPSRTVVCINDDATGANPSRSASRAIEIDQEQTQATLEKEEGKPLCQWKNCTHTRPFNRKEDVLRHVKSIHLSIKPYKCGARGCLKSFSRRDKIKEHIVKNHSSFAQAWEKCVVYDG